MKYASLGLALVAFAVGLSSFAAPKSGPRKAPASRRAAPPSKPAPKPAPKPSPPSEPEAPARPTRPPARLPSPIEMSRVKVEIGPEHLRVTSDIVLSRGDWAGDELRFHVAYGAPAVPLAFEAWLCSAQAGESSPETCIPLPHATAVRAAPDAAFILGPSAMAGEEIELSHEALSSFFTDAVSTSRAVLRLRTLRALPSESASGEREVLIRLDREGKKPRPPASLEVEAVDGATLRKVQARLCGPEGADEHLPILSTAPDKPSVHSPIPRREVQGDLCVRFTL